MNHRHNYPSYRDLQADLAGTFEIAANLGVDLKTVKRWIERRSSTLCPEPIVRLRNGHVYSLTEWEGWYAVWRVTRGQETWWMNKT